MATKKKMLQAAAGNATGGAGLNVEDVFSTYLYEGTNATQTITNGIDLDGEGGLVWIKDRDQSADNQLLDSEQGFRYILESNNSDVPFDFGANVITPQSDGFDLSSSSRVNQSGQDFASWTFRKARKFFDVVTYTGTGSAGLTINHSLGSVPGFIIVKRLNSTNAWAVYHRSLGNNRKLELNKTDGIYDIGNSSAWNTTTPTDTQFYLGADGGVNGNGGTYVAYLFAHNDGDGEFGGEADADIIKCGSYVGGGSTDVSVDLGFEPQWLMIKRTDTANNWFMFDTMRGITNGVGNGDAYLRANLSNAEGLGLNFTDGVDLTATGFELKGDFGGINHNGGDYIYIAIRRGTKVPESASEVFDVNLASATATNPAVISTIPTIDMAILSSRTGTDKHYISSRLTGAFLKTESTAVEAGAGSSLGQFDNQYGFYGTTGTLGTNYFAWMWKRAPGFFDAVAYTGNGVVDPGQQLNHNLGVAPEMIWVKSRSSAASWECWFNGFTTDEYIRLDSDGGKSSNGDYPRFPVLPTETTLNVGGGSSANGSNEDYIAYLFASLDGISKVGSFYHEDGTPTNVDCGFTNGARFVLWKKTTGSGPWLVMDTQRGIVSGNDPYLILNTTASEDSSYDVIDPLSSGFTVAPVISSGTYNFYAIA